MLEARPSILEVRDLTVHFSVKAPNAWPWTAIQTLKAVDGVSLSVAAGESLGVVGEWGCGRSTLAGARLECRK